MARNPFSSENDGKKHSDVRRDSAPAPDADTFSESAESEYVPPPSSVPPVLDDDDSADGELPRDFRVYPGTYLFSIGPKQSGKSTFQSLLLRYLMRTQNFTTTHIREPDGMLLEADALLDSWRKSWDENRFPKPTRVRFPTVLRFKVTPQRYKGIPHPDFGIIEVSGEDYERLIAPSNERLKLPAILEEYLAHPRVKLIFAFVCRGPDPGGADAVFQRMVEELAYRNPNFAKRCSPFFVIADPRSAKVYLSEQSGRELPPGPLNQTHYVREVLATSSNALRGWRVKYKQAKFDVGPLVRDKDGELRIKRYDERDAEKIFEWMYGVITGEIYGPSKFRLFLSDLLGDRPG